MSLLRPLLIAALCWGAFAYSGLRLHDYDRLDQRLEVLRVRLPLLVQLLYSGGDPYLATNLNVFRSILVDASVTEQETYRIQGQLQADAASFNPRHEDNYYIAAAILPWNGQVEAGQEVLLKAAQSRQWDMWPAFYYAFNGQRLLHNEAQTMHRHCAAWLRLGMSDKMILRWRWMYCAICMRKAPIRSFVGCFRRVLRGWKGCWHCVQLWLTTASSIKVNCPLHGLS
jgi:hypothetical protein